MENSDDKLFELLKQLRDNTVLRAAVKDGLRAIENAEEERQKQTILDEIAEKMSKCTCCPVHPHYSIPITAPYTWGRFGGGAFQ